VTAPAVVVDSACLITLERIVRLDLLPAVFSEVLARPAVRDEFGSPLAGVTFRPLSSELPLASLRTQLYRGEASRLPSPANAKVASSFWTTRKRDAAREMRLCVASPRDSMSCGDFAHAAFCTRIRSAGFLRPTGGTPVPESEMARSARDVPSGRPALRSRG